MPDNVEKELLEYTKIIGGLRYEAEFFKELLMGGRGVLEDSTVYQQLVGRGRAEGRVEGKAEGARQVLLHVAEERFGPAPA